MHAKRLLIHGAVQGVGYRVAMQQEALRLGLRGWVRNQRDGTVEAVVCGDDDALTTIISWAQRGPRFSRVSSVKVLDTEYVSGTGFEILPTI